MAYDAPQPGSLKRKRRRRQDKPAVSAKLYLDSSLKGEVGVLSSDLLEELYVGTHVPFPVNGEISSLFAAVTPWTPNTAVAELNWVILPVRGLLTSEKALPPNTIRFPASALGTQSFVRVAQALAPTKTLRQNTTVEVKLSDVVPLPLDTVFVSVDTEAVRKLEDVNKKYSGGFSGSGLPTHMSRRTSGKRTPAEVAAAEAAAAEVEERLKALVHQGLRGLHIVHTDDTVTLALSHAVTHAPAPPGKILACEPVSQGYVTSATKVVIVPSADRRAHAHGNKSKGLLSPRLDEDSGEEDTANEAFFSASEDNYPIKPVVTSKSATDMSNTDDMIDSSAEESNLSDDSDDMISLTKPGLADAPSGISSALTSATPRAFSSRVRSIGPGSIIGTGVHTPGSVFSNATATTARGGGPSTRSKTFRVQGLYERIPIDMLHPRPSDDEDEEARVYVDATALARLGCFSGDWVKIEPAENTMLPLMSAFGHLDDSIPQHWRPVKVYTLPESMSRRQTRYPVNSRQQHQQGRRDSNTSLSLMSANTSTVATIYLSPVLLANLHDPTNLSMSTIPVTRKPSLKRPVTPKVESPSARLPPTASEVTLRKIVTPLSTERTLNTTLYANLKQYFEEQQRIVKPGDLIAIPIDESLGRSVYEGEAEQDGSNATALLSQVGSGKGSRDQRTPMNVAWFTVEDISTVPSEDLDGSDGEIWADAALIDPTKMTMRQSGDDRRKLPSTTTNTWQYYLGVQKVPTKPVGAVVAPTGLPEVARPFISPLQRRLRELIAVSVSSRAVHMGMPPLTVLITSTQRHIGKARTVARACADLGLHFFPIDAHDIASEGSGVGGGDVQSQGLLEARCERALDCGPEFTALCITHIDVLHGDRAAASLATVLETCRVLIATTTDIDKVPDAVRGLFTHELEMSAPDEGEREGILRDVVAEAGVATAPDLDLSSVAVKTAALVAGDLVDVVDRAIVAKTERLESLATASSAAGRESVTVRDIQLAGGVAATAVLPADFDAAVDMARKNFADAIGAPKIPNVQWSDVGGLTHVKDAVIETIQLPLSRPELFAKGLKKRSGILFYGPPGTGKTLLAKAIATEFSLNFFSVKGPELLNMYIGESEANVRRVFQRARDARPCAVFFDELDSVAPKRGNQGDSGGVMDRIVSQLLAELDGMSDGDEGGGGVFVIGATNRPDLLDQALLRPGRFDKMLYLGISDTHEKQATILQALTRKFTLDPSVSLPRVAESLPFTFTGADLYALCSDAMLKAVTRAARAVDGRVAALNADRATRGLHPLSVAAYFDHHGTAADTDVRVTEDDFALARRDLVPSVSMDELRHYEQVRATFEGGTTKKKEEGAPAVEEEEVPAAAGAAPSPPSAAALHQARQMQPSPSPSSQPSEDGSSSYSRTSSSRAAVNKLLRAAGVRGKLPGMNGKKAANGPESDDEDDYVIKTDRLALGSPGKGKGKGVRSPAPSASTDAGEDLYD